MKGIKEITELQDCGIPILVDVHSLAGEDPEQCDLSL